VRPDPTYLRSKVRPHRAGGRFDLRRNRPLSPVHRGSAPWRRTPLCHGACGSQEWPGRAYGGHRRRSRDPPAAAASRSSSMSSSALSALRTAGVTQAGASASSSVATFASGCWSSAATIGSSSLAASDSVVAATGSLSAAPSCWPFSGAPSVSSQAGAPGTSGSASAPSAGVVLYGTAASTGWGHRRRRRGGAVSRDNGETDQIVRD
jgi:hypothetical protein